MPGCSPARGESFPALKTLVGALESILEPSIGFLFLLWFLASQIVSVCQKQNDERRCRHFQTVFKLTRCVVLLHASALVLFIVCGV